LGRIEFGRVLSERSWFSMLEISELMYSTPIDVHGDWITMSLQTPDVASVWEPTQFLLAVPRRGDSETWGLPRFHVSHSSKPDSAFVCESTQLLQAGPQRDRGGTAKRGNSHDSRLQAGPVPPSAGPLHLYIYGSGTAYPVWE